MSKITLRAARINAMLTQAEAARLLGVGLSTLQRWETGKGFPKEPSIRKICALYKVEYNNIQFDI